MTRRVDSLNVTTAASIAMYHSFAEQLRSRRGPPATVAEQPG